MPAGGRQVGVAEGTRGGDRHVRGLRFHGGRFHGAHIKTYLNRTL